MQLIGLTGGIATGKSTVARMFRKLGVPTIDTDEIAHKITGPGGSAHKRVIKAFGTADRRKLAEIVFTDASKRRRLEKITHPLIWKEVARVIPQLSVVAAGFSLRKITQPKGCGYQFPPITEGLLARRAGGEGIIIIEVPLLFETGWNKKVDAVIVVTCKKPQQFKRCKKEFLNRIKTQMPLAKKVKLADYVIDNSGTLAETRRQVVNLVKKCLVKVNGKR